jgi:peroxiredoxin
MGTISEGDTLPNFYFQDLNGDDVYLEEIISEQVLMMYFEPDCELCLVELEMIRDEVTEQSQFDRFVMISGANPLHLIKLRDRYELSSPLLYDYQGFFRENLNIFTFPFNMVVDENLVIVEIKAGSLTPDEVVEIARSD